MTTLRKELVRRLEKKGVRELDWDGLVVVLAGLGTVKKAKIIQAIKSNAHGSVGAQLCEAVLTSIRTEASSTADSMLLDGALSVEELGNIYEAES